LKQLLTRIIYILVLLSALTSGAQASSIKNIDQLDLKQYNGKVVYLDFWASWCKPCQKSFPWMNDMVQRYPVREFKLITINLDSNQKAMNDFLSRVPALFDIYHDPSGTLAEKFQLQGMPTSYLIDKSGKVVTRHIGFQTELISEYEAEIEELLSSNSLTVLSPN
jgi:thiol-disulfide isomerase/thioredoxin